jgi:hypothetical protein
VLAFRLSIFLVILCIAAVRGYAFCAFLSGTVLISVQRPYPPPPPPRRRRRRRRAGERWLPVHTVKTIMLSVISMLADPNDKVRPDWLLLCLF